LQAEARPVSYPGGWTFMTMNNGDKSTAHLHFSPTAKYSIGYKGEWWRDDEFQLHAVQLNTLLKRWNNTDSQANVYLKTALGGAYSDRGSFDGKTEPAGFVEMAADWEDRRYFTSYAARYTEAGDIARFFSHRGRVGIAPYIGDYGDLHTWLMLEVEHTPTNRDEVTITPLVRLFKGVNMVELGLSDKGEAMLNWIIRF